jgi:hypothetical protein
MTGDYPCFKASYAHEELVEHFLLSPAEHTLVALLMDTHWASRLNSPPA